MEIPGVSKKRCGISRGGKKDRGISMGSWSLALEIPMPMDGWTVMEFCEVSRGEIVPGISKG